MSIRVGAESILNRISTFFRVSHLSTGAQGLKSTSAALPDHKQGAALEVQQPGYESAPTWDASIIERGLMYHITVLAPLTSAYERHISKLSTTLENEI